MRVAQGLRSPLDRMRGAESAPYFKFSPVGTEAEGRKPANRALP